MRPSLLALGRSSNMVALLAPIASAARVAQVTAVAGLRRSVVTRFEEAFREAPWATMPVEGSCAAFLVS